ncbi:MAG: prepilin-type N-terminal cleavage/methylation domain-containing protein [Planctomycetota bacterium]
MMRRRCATAFSLLEVIAAVVIVAVISAATLATLSPMRQHSETRNAIRDVASLNMLSETFYLENNEYPQSVDCLINAGLIPATTPAQQRRIRELKLLPHDGQGKWSMPSDDRPTS